jgi:DNA ligase-1
VLPNRVLDGELWIGRSKFDEVSGIVRKKHPVDSEWRSIRFMVFDLPSISAPFVQRYTELSRLLNDLSVPWLQVVEQTSVTSREQLLSHLDTVVKEGGEGLMLHKHSAFYQEGRTESLLKLKPKFDAEAKVIAHIPGKGMFEGLLGSLLVEDEQGKVFKVGSGFSHEERAYPPEIGTNITYEYSGYTKTGLPRFVRFVRVRRAL